MKFTRSYCYAFILLLFVLPGLATPGIASEATGESSVQDIKQETTELLQALKAYGVEQRDAALEQSRVALENLDRRIEKLEKQMLDQWDEMDQAARDKAQASLQALRQQRNRVAEWYGSLKSSSAGAWGHMKQGFSSAYRAMHEAWEKSEKEFSADKRK